MITVHDPAGDHSAPDTGTSTRLSTWYAQGPSDGLGDRLLMFDNTSTPSWEILRFKPALARAARFEAAVRQRVEQLAHFHHDAFPVVRPIKRLGQDDGLAVVSTYTGGATLSEALTKPRSAEFALRLIRQLVPALASFQRLGPGIAHGALTVDRVAFNGEGRLTIREHMLGAAIGALEWPASKLWSEFGILVPKATGAVKIDERTDIAQLAIVALSLMAGRRVGPHEYPDKTRELLDELALKNHWLNPSNSARFQSLRHWLERALQLTGQSFTSVHDAQLGLGGLQEYADSTPMPGDELPPSPRPPFKEHSSSGIWSAARLSSGVAAQPVPVATVSAQTLAANQAASHGDRRVDSGTADGSLWSRIPVPVVRWAGVAFAVLAIGEAIFIANMMFTRPAAKARVSAPPPSSPDLQPIQPVQSSTAPAGPVNEPPAIVNVPVVKTRKETPAPAPSRSGGIRVTAPIELTVLDGDRVIGSTADGPIVMNAGRRELEFVNSAVGFRARHVVDVIGGEIATLTLTVPNGRLSINAQPWAAVWIDGTAAGETPLGDLSILPGHHEIVFRHPQLGERRETTVVRADAETRVSVNFQK